MRLQNKLYKNISCITLATFMLITSTLQVFASTIPDKENFYVHTKEMYNRKEFSDEEAKNLVEDYKTRLTMYTDTQYVLGRESNQKSYSYNDANSRQRPNTSGGANLPDNLAESMDTTQYEPGSKVNDTAYQNTMRYYDEIANACNEFGIDVDMMIALICDESSGNHETVAAYRARGGAGYGLCQIEKPGREITSMQAVKADGQMSEKIIINGPEDVQDPAVNVRIGVMQLKNRLDEANGNYMAALQGYNYGSGGLNEVIDQYKLATGDSRTNAEIKADTSNLEWMKYRVMIHENPSLLGSRYAGYKSYGTPDYVERVLQWYPIDTGTVTGKGGDTIIRWFQGKVPPQYEQEYYGDVKYGDSTLSVSGAGPTVLAMVVTNLTSRHYTPEDAARDSKKYYVTNEGSLPEILYDVEKFGINVRSVKNNLEKVKLALKDGALVVAAVGSKEEGAITGEFVRTGKGNLIILYGYDSETDTVHVADPDGGNFQTLAKKENTYSLEYVDAEAVGGLYIYTLK